MNDIIKRYLELKITSEYFFEELYKNEDLQNMLDQETDIPRYTNSTSLLLYLLSGDPKSLGFIVNVKELLGAFLTKNGVEFQSSARDNEIYNLVLYVQPSWLDAQPEYLQR